MAFDGNTEQLPAVPGGTLLTGIIARKKFMASLLELLKLWASEVPLRMFVQAFLKLNVQFQCDF